MIKKILTLVIVMALLNACDEFNNTATFPDFVQWESSSASIDEDATEPITINVQLVGVQQSSAINVEFTVEETGVTEGVNYSFPNGKVLSIDANSSTGSIQIAAIDNDVVGTAQFITLTLSSASGVSTGSETAPNKSIVVNINENDFWCPRNQLASVVTTELDVGYSTGAVSISLVTSPDGCLAFQVDGGGASLGFPADATYGQISLIEDSPESLTGTIGDAEGVLFTTLDGTGSYGNTMDIFNGVYDLEAGTFQFDYLFYATDGSLLYPGTFAYD